MNRPTYCLCFLIFAVAVTVLAYLGKLNGGMELMMISVGVPRLHDIGRSGWIVVGAIGIEIVVVFGALFAGASADDLELTSGVVFLVIAALGVWLGAIPGQAQPNKWGDPPLPGIRFGRPLRQG